MVLAKDAESLSYMVSYFLMNVDPLAKACLWTTSETLKLYFPRGYSLNDLKRIGFNLVYRFGDIYDLVYEIVDIFLIPLETSLSGDEWKYVGGIPGRILSNIFYPKLQPMPKIVYPNDSASLITGN
jgi:hypothetical protein